MASRSFAIAFTEVNRECADKVVLSLRERILRLNHFRRLDRGESPFPLAEREDYFGHCQQPLP
jgi:hypothetical protein